MEKDLIMVAGGAGFIGSHTVVELQNAGYRVVIVDNFSNSSHDVIDGIFRTTGIRPELVEADCTDISQMEAVFRSYPDIVAVIDFAASKAVGESIEKPLLYYRNNIVSLLNLIECINAHSVRGLVFSSSCTVYGEPDENPVTELTPRKAATSPYGNTKQISEDIISDVIRSGVNFKSIILRYFNPVGSHPAAEIGELPNGVPQNLVPYLTQAALGIRKELSVFGDDYNTPDGTCIRDYIDVVDLAKAHVKAVDRLLLEGDCDNIEVFNLGTGRGVSVKELIESFERATGVKVPHRIAPRRHGDIEKVWADPSKANKVLGWRAETSVDDTMRSAWAWQLKLRERGVM